MSKVFVGLFMAVFVGALAYEMLNRTKPALAEQFETRFSDGLDSLLKPSGAKA